MKELTVAYIVYATVLLCIVVVVIQLYTINNYVVFVSVLHGLQLRVRDEIVL